MRSNTSILDPTVLNQPTAL
uniref:Uncharacterized protein n=1 Tax=Arundo donax TaxID=35708 RepID=A0A0A8ZGI1_ARUDO